MYGFHKSCSSEAVLNRIRIWYINSLWYQETDAPFPSGFSDHLLVCPTSRKQVFTQVARAKRVVVLGNKGRLGEGQEIDGEHQWLETQSRLSSWSQQAMRHDWQLWRQAF